MRSLTFFVFGLTAYIVVLIVSQRMLASIGPDSTMTPLLAVAPIIPAVFICGVVVQAIRNLDEMQRKLQLEALAVAFAGTALITFGYGFLEGNGLPKLSMFAVWPLMSALWFTGVMVGLLRHR
ncbi:hypothetical protein RM190_17930 [Paracoccus sp. CPCC 101403]|uniref:Transmembrane protein n=2 Tax=Paracoccus broussonetiae TaxID=3075834 RepID=A0ABU3EHT0_9RHOB|nr:hypothetical protein [Paracoccus sp. CPCC 101403]MDT1063749.1 hypothetical protein [Paracoccus sp. CPCC 101403]